MTPQLVTPDSAWWLLLVAFAGSMVLVAVWVIGLFPRGLTPVCPRWLTRGLALLVAAILVVDAERLIPEHPTSSTTAVLRVFVLSFAIVAIWIQGWLVQKVYLGTQWRRSALVALALSFLVIAGWSSQRFYSSTTPVATFDNLLTQQTGHPVRSKRYVAVTDSGREIPLLRWQHDTENSHQTIDSVARLLLGDMPRAIQREGADDNSNCHGWVFTNGRFLLAGESVEQILADNLYEQVTSPEEGDIVIYRNLDNQIVHTGLVVGMLIDGSVIIESKWSVGARYLHPPEAQPYSENFTYFRTARGSHNLAIRFQNREHIVGETKRPQVPRLQAPRGHLPRIRNS